MRKAFACFGELLLRLTAPGRELLFQTPRLDLHFGGAEANVAVGLARLGHSVRMISRVPDNPIGAGAISYLRSHGVDASGVSTGSGRMGLYFLSQGASLRPSQITYDREASSFALAEPAAFDWDKALDGVDLLHLSGITPALGAGPSNLAISAAEAAQRLGVPISFDANYRAQLWERWDSNPREVLGRMIGMVDILFANHRDMSLLLGRAFNGDGSERRRAAAEAAFEAFPNLKLMACTARHVDSADSHRLSARLDTPDEQAETEEVVLSAIVDRIGGGDAFAAGVLHGWAEGQNAQGMAQTGLALACLKHSLAGDASLFGASDVEAFLAGGLDVRR
jgi:2-dehydro-3-deoxygluconokinase